MEEIILDDTITEKEVNLFTVNYAGFWIRVLASFIDGLILTPIYILGIYNSLYLKSLPLMILTLVIGAVYKPLLEWKKSATWGKMALNIKVVDGSLNRISGEQALIRYIPWMISFVFSLITYVLMFELPEFNSIDELVQLGTISQESSINTLSTIYNFIFLLIVLSVAFDKRKQGLHDKMAKTYCIRVE